MENYMFVILMVCYFYLAESRRVVQVFKDAAGMWWADKWRPLAGCAVNLFFNILSVQYIGMHGVILSTIISYLFVEIPWETYVLFKNYFKGYLYEYIIDMIKFLLCLFACAVAGVVICANISLKDVIGFVVKGCVCFIESNLIFILFFKNTEELNMLKRNVKRFINKIRK